MHKNGPKCDWFRTILDYIATTFNWTFCTNMNFNMFNDKNQDYFPYWMASSTIKFVCLFVRYTFKYFWQFLTKNMWIGWIVFVPKLHNLYTLAPVKSNRMYHSEFTLNKINLFFVVKTLCKTWRGWNLEYKISNIIICYRLVRIDLPWNCQPHFLYGSCTLVFFTWVPHHFFSNKFSSLDRHPLLSGACSQRYHVTPH